MVIDAATKRNIRGAILKLVYQRRARQEHRFDLVAMTSALNNLDFIVYRDVIAELLEDLCDAGYLTCKQAVDSQTGETLITRIQLIPKGRNIVEKIESDPAISV